MTLQALDALAFQLLRVSGAFVRRFAHYSYPSQDPWEMSIEVAQWVNGRLEVVEVPDLVNEGLTLRRVDGRPIYVVARVDEFGAPYRAMRFG